MVNILKKTKIFTFNAIRYFYDFENEDVLNRVVATYHLLFVRGLCMCVFLNLLICQMRQYASR